MFVKICGLGTRSDVEVSCAAGADAVGFVLSRTSVRALEPAVAGSLIATVPDGVLSVLVVHDIPAADAGRIARDLGADVLQLHGGYTADDFAAAAEHAPRRWRATSVAATTELRVGAHGEEALLLDSPRAGSGHTWDTSALPAVDGRWILAGGLRPDNVAAAVRATGAWGVDVSSGVESARGVKDHDLIRDFVARAR